MSAVHAPVVGAPRATRSGRPGAALRALPWAFAVATVLAQVAYPLVHGEGLRRLTVATVVLFFLASASHAAVHRGPGWATVLVAIAAGGGLLAEAVGVATGYPFGAYSYAHSLGPMVAGVPLVVPLAWAMMAYPALLVARRLGHAVPLVGGLALASWDLFLDPQMVAAHRWTWSHPTPSLPGIDLVPVTNFAGWLAVAVVMMALLDRLPRRMAGGGNDALPAALYLWTWAGSVVGNVVFFGRPAVGLVGGVVMGLVAVPFAVSLRRGRR